MAKKLFICVAILAFACALPLDKIGEKVHADGPVDITALIQQPTAAECSRPVVTVTEFCIQGSDEGVLDGFAEVQLSVNEGVYWPIDGGFKDLEENKCHELGPDARGVPVNTDDDLKMEMLEEDFFSWSNDEASATLTSDQWNLKRDVCDADYTVVVAALFDSDEVEDFCVDDECLSWENPEDSYVWKMKVRVCDAAYQPVDNGQCCPNDRILQKDGDTTCCPEFQQPILNVAGELACGAGVPPPPPPPPPPPAKTGCSSGEQEVTNTDCCPNDRILEEVTTTCCPEGQQPIGEPLACGFGVPSFVPPPPVRRLLQEAEDLYAACSGKEDTCYSGCAAGDEDNYDNCETGCGAEFSSCMEGPKEESDDASCVAAEFASGYHKKFCPKDTYQNDRKECEDQGCEWKGCSGDGIQEVTDGKCCPNDRILEVKTTTCCLEGQQPISIDGAPLACGAGVPPPPPGGPPPTLVEEKTKGECGPIEDCAPGSSCVCPKHKKCRDLGGSVGHMCFNTH